VLRRVDEVIEWDADQDDGYRGVDPALYRERQPSPSWFEETARAIVMGIDERALVTNHGGI
jgi:hypothetical protein